MAVKKQNADALRFSPGIKRARKERVAKRESKIDAILRNTSKEKLQEIFAAFYSIPEDERSYITNYWSLSEAAREVGINIESISGSTAVVESLRDEDSDGVLLYFILSDREAADMVPETLTIEQCVLVTLLLDKLEKSENFNEKDEYRRKLTGAKQEIAAVQAEIDRINTDVKKKLYPFEGISLKDKKTAGNIVSCYEALFKYDRGKTLWYEDVIRPKHRSTICCGAL